MANRTIYEVSLCTSCGSCPKLIIISEGKDNYHIKITDDFGGEVKLSLSELRILRNAIENLEKEIFSQTLQNSMEKLEKEGVDYAF